MAFNLFADREIARGGYSSVFAGENTITGEPVALKVIETTKNGSVLFDNETTILSRLPQHPNLVKCFGAAEMQGKRIVALEWFPHPTLASFIEKRGPVSESVAFQIIDQIVDVINCLADAGIAHRDIKPDNILIDFASLKIKVIDFGLASILRDGVDTRSTSFIGTPHYMAPQVLSKRQSYRIVRADLFSAGLVFWELLIGKNPFSVAESREEMINMMPSIFKFDAHSSKARKILSGLLAIDESKRICAAEALKIVRKTASKKRPSLRLSFPAIGIVVG